VSDDIDSGVNAKTLAGYIGVSTRSVTRLATDGIVVRIRPGEYDLRASVTAYCAHLRQTASARGGEASLEALRVEKIRQAKAVADELETKAKLAAGQVVLASEVQAEWSSILSTVRNGMLALSSRLQQRLSHLTTQDAAEIDAEVRIVLSTIGKGA
jgi:phage terminase Nu1 subunit (DNA packaging protein)